MADPQYRTSSELPAVRKVERIEMLRDGGSLTATFESDGGNRYTLLTQVLVVDDPVVVKRVAGYAPPVLIDCDPAKRPQNTATRIYSGLSGPSAGVSWSQARDILSEIARLAQGLEAIKMEWLRDMLDVVARDGRPKDRG